MMFRILFSCVLSVAVLTDAIAGSANASGQKSNWGANDVSLNSHLCAGRDLADGVIGKKGTTCIDANTIKNLKLTGSKAKIAGCDTASGSEDYGVMMMVARDIKTGGARLCATTVVSSRSGGYKNSITTYKNPSVGDKCVWLCRSGYYGDTCSEKEGTPTKADSTPIKKSDFDTLETSAGAANIENNIAMFEANQNRKCTLPYYNNLTATTKNEHDMILAISNWTPTGHGAFVSPYVVRAAFKGNSKKVSWPEIKRVGTQTLVCKNGYKPNAGKTDCEPMNRSATVETTEEKLTQMCHGWDKANFKSSEHKMQLVGDCYQFRCSQPGYAFNEGEYSTCIECSANLRGGVSPRDGACVKCELGKVFDSGAASSGYCVDATRLSKTDMQYGPGKGKKDFDGTDKIKDQCWTKTDPDEYKACVLGTTSSTGGGKIKLNKDLLGKYKNLANNKMMAEKADLQLNNVQQDTVVKP